MIKANCQHSEEEIIDLIMGKLSEDQSRLLESHLMDCEACERRHKDWKLILQEEVEPVQPSRSLKKKIKFHILLKLYVKKFRLPIMIPTAATFIFFIMAPIWYVKPDPSIPSHLAKVPQANMIMRMNTVQYELTPVSSDWKGVVWLNHESQEMLMLIEGAEPSEYEDYQGWLMTSNKPTNIGLVQWNGKLGHIYFQGKEVKQMEDLYISVEPKGGSIVPTGYQAIRAHIH